MSCRQDAPNACLPQRQLHNHSTMVKIRKALLQPFIPLADLSPFGQLSARVPFPSGKEWGSLVPWATRGGNPRACSGLCNTAAQMLSFCFLCPVTISFGVMAPERKVSICLPLVPQANYRTFQLGLLPQSAIPLDTSGRHCLSDIMKFGVHERNR